MPRVYGAIVDRWQELEASQAPTPPAFQIPQTLAEALQLAADQAKQLELQAPKVAFVEKLVERKTLLTATQVAQKHKLSAIKLNKMLDEIGGVYSQAVKRKRVFTQPWVDKDYGDKMHHFRVYGDATEKQVAKIYNRLLMLAVSFQPASPKHEVCDLCKRLASH